jgi:protein tyrosine/serine phosphatase
MTRILIGIICFTLAVAASAAGRTGNATNATIAAVAAVQLPDGYRTSEHLYNLPGLANVGRIAPGVYRGAQPEATGYAVLKRMGIRTVIDLRTTENDRQQVEAAGMRSIRVPILMTNNGLRENVDRTVALLADPANQPVFVHCRHGQDRTGIVSAAYRMKIQGWSLTAAEAEMQAFGFNDVWINYKQFIRDYGKQVTKK